MKKLLFLSVVAMLFSCSKKADFSKIKQGMPLKEVVDLVGEPNEKQDNPMFGKWYVYETHIIVFRADTVAEITTVGDLKNTMEGVNKDLDSLNQTIKNIQ